VNAKDLFIVARRKKNITLREIADNIGCTSALLCMYEKDKCNIIPEKETAYKQYILQK
jgi:transcriptional regulator with XRE-family HTH domain